MENIEKVVIKDILEILDLSTCCATWDNILDEIKRLKRIERNSCSQEDNQNFFDRSIEVSPPCAILNNGKGVFAPQQYGSYESIITGWLNDPDKK